MSKLSGTPIWQVDAFADDIFNGNPAAVCMLDQFPNDEMMQNVAAEMNLSETSFVVPTGVDGSFYLRWFTPALEVDLCGHATLAAAHILIQQGLVAAGAALRFQTRSGELICEQVGDSITLDFPATPMVNAVDPGVANQVCEALGIPLVTVLRSTFDTIAIVEDAKVVRGLQPDFGLLEKIETRGVIVTAPSDEPGIDFVSRFFAPQCGVNEDPVTGSAHSCLAPFWAERFGRASLVGYQASRRGGEVQCQVDGDRVKLAGKAATVFEGRMSFEI